MTSTPAPARPYAAESVSMADGWCTVDGTELPWEIHDVTIEPYDPSTPSMAPIKVATLHMVATCVFLTATGNWAIDGHPVPWLIAHPSEFPPAIDLTPHGYLRLSLPLLLFTDQETPRAPIVWDAEDREDAL